MQSPTQLFSSLPSTIIMMDVVNFFSLAVSNNSDDKEIATTVGGAIAFVSAYQQSQHVVDVMEQNGEPARKKHRGSLFR